MTDKWKASELAAELRRIADALDREPEAEIVQPMMTFFCDKLGDPEETKQRFLTAIRLMPKPLYKKYENNDYVLHHGSHIDGGEESPLWLRIRASRNFLCRMVRPAQSAEYECESLLSLPEKASLEVQP